jgi:hypothetical protein
MEVSQAIPVPAAAKSKSSNITARIHQDRRRKLIAVSITLLVISICIWLRPHALDSNVLFWVLWSRPLALAYIAFGGRVGYCVIANVPFRKEPKNPFAVSAQTN